MAEARVGHTATLLADGGVLVVGGYDREAARIAGVEPSPLASAELYDPGSGRWTATGSMATPRVGHTATLLRDGRVLVVGGGEEETRMEGGPRSSTAELYDPSSGKWTAAGNMGEVRKGFTATLLLNGRVLVAGGDGGYVAAELYDPSSGKWTATGSMADGRFGHTATLLADGTVLVAGGCACSDPGAWASAELYHPSSGKWTATGSMTEARIGHTATLLADGSVLVTSGCTCDERGPLASAELYDPSRGKWTTTASTVLAGPTALLADGRVLVVGGDDDDATARSAELYDPSSGHWTATASMATARVGHTATRLPDGRVLVAGGSSGGEVDVMSAELYDPRGGF
jgi:N-acetylneuraminic acid mutarotase